MKILVLPSVVLLLLAACATGRRDPELADAYAATQSPSIYGLLGARERLALTSVQVTALDSIAEELRTANRLLAGRMRAVTGARPGGPIVEPRDSAERAAFVPLLRKVASNNQRALAGVRSVLTDEQREAACRIAAERMRRGPEMRGGMRGPPPPPRRRRPGLVVDPDVVPDSVMPGAARTWPWCPPLER